MVGFLDYFLYNFPFIVKIFTMLNHIMDFFIDNKNSCFHNGGKVENFYNVFNLRKYVRATLEDMDMKKSVKGTRTEKNLLTAFAGEAQARNRYTYFASAARKEGYEQIANIFIETAENEKEHAKVFFKHLEGGDAEITAFYPAGIIGDTKSNLTAAAAGEKMEWTTIYADFARIAKKEGFPEISRSFEQISKVEKFHESRYRKLIKNMINKEVFVKKMPVKWHCINCGYIFEGAEAPKECPACKHPQSYYELLAENY
jgi:rubrerythrin